ncbi:MAG TPA: YCF48-related protein, partial [Thermoanaerobaculia bacterium]|nr:YCF48-related protein [Thermoanaerobaculia bacterium]
MTRKAFPILFAAALVFASAASASGWRPLPLWGGDVRSLAIHPDDPDMVFAGTSAGQLYLSRDAGRSWNDAGSHLPFPGWVVNTLRFDPNKTGRLWAGLWGVWGGGHVAFSDDMGKTWVSRVAGLPEEPVYTMALVPGREGRIYVGTLSGVWSTEDSGESWRRLTADLPEAQKVTSLLVDAERPDTIIAGTWRRAYRTEDGGRTWAGIFEGMVLDSEVFSLTPVPERPGEIWATTCGWVYRSLDGGNKWERFKEGFEERRTVSFSALPDGRLLAGTVAGIHVSADGGKTWKR